MQGLSALSRLTALTQMSFINVALTDAALEGIAACTQLQKLRLRIKLEPDIQVTAAGIRHLQQLKGSIELEFD